MLFCVAFGIALFLILAQNKVVSFCDEIYSYTIVNSDKPTRQFDAGVWYSGSELNDVLTRSNGDSVVKTAINIAKDKVHPPIYYGFLYISTAFFGNVFSKWSGLLVNLIFFAGTIAVIWLIIKRLFDSVALASIGALTYTVSLSSLSDALLIRMYMTMTFFTAVFVYVNLDCNERLLKKKLDWWLIVSTVCGFLTQYYFALIAIAFFAVNAVKNIKPEDKNLGRKLTKNYFISMAVSVGISTVLWPVWPICMLKNTHNEAMADSITDISGLFGKMGNGIMIVQNMVFQKALIPGIIVLLLILAFVTVAPIVKNKAPRIREIVIKLFAAIVLYSAIVRVVTPDYLTSGRYYYAAAMMEIVLFIICVLTVATAFFDKITPAVVAGSCLLIITAILSITGYGIDYYGDSKLDKEQLAILEEHKGAIWIYPDGESMYMDAGIPDALGCEYMIVLDDEPEAEYYKWMDDVTDLIIPCQIYEKDGAEYDKVDKALYYFIGSSGRFFHADYMFDRKDLRYYHAYIAE